MNPKKILITGANGYIGSTLASTLARDWKQAEFVFVCGPENTNNLERLEKYCNEKKAKSAFETADILDSEKISSLAKGADAVIHAAAIHTIGACARDPEKSRRVNIEGTRIIVDACEKQKVKKIIFPSSIQVYAGTKAKKITEKSKVAPLNEYAEQKIACEEIIRKSKLNYTILRKSNVFGLGFTQQFDTVIPIFIIKALKEKKIPVFGSGKQERNFLHIRDAMQAYKKALLSDYKGTLNIGGKKETKIIDLAKIISKKLDAEITHAPQARKETSKHRVFSWQKAKKILGYAPKISLEKGIDEFIQWAKKNQASI